MRASALALALVPFSQGAHAGADAGAAADPASSAPSSVARATGLDDSTLQMLMSNPLVQRVIAYSARQVQTDPLWEAKFRDLQETARSPGGVGALVARLQQSASPPVRTLTAPPPVVEPSRGYSSPREVLRKGFGCGGGRRAATAATAAAGAPPAREARSTGGARSANLGREAEPSGAQVRASVHEQLQAILGAKQAALRAVLDY